LQHVLKCQKVFSLCNPFAQCFCCKVLC
jgi:hypothetical protein